MKFWSKKKTFFLLILLFGAVVHLTVCLLFINYIFVVGDIAGVLLISVFFIFFSTFIFTKKIIGFRRRLIGGVLILIFQICFFIIISIPLVVVDWMVDIVTPKFIHGDEKFGQSVVKRFQEKYKIREVNPSDILHSSYYSIGEDF